MDEAVKVYEGELRKAHGEDYNKLMRRITALSNYSPPHRCPAPGGLQDE